MLYLPTNEPVKLLDESHFAGTNAIEFTFRFSNPISKMYLQGGQVAKYDDIATSAQYTLYEGLGIGSNYISNTSGTWSNPFGSTMNFTTLSTLTTPGYDGCATYKLILSATPTGSGVFDFAVLGVE